MNFLDYLGKKKELYNSLLNFIEDDTDIQENFYILTNYLNAFQLSDDRDELKEFFNTLLKVTRNHHRNKNFFNKIEKILSYFEKKIKECFTNHEIYKIFKKDKRVLLFLLENNILILDKFIAINHLLKIKYFSYDTFNHHVLNNQKNEKEVYQKYKQFASFTYSDTLLKVRQNNRATKIVILHKLKENSMKYMKTRLYFYPEIKQFADKETIEKLEKILLRNDPTILNCFNEKRKLGENDSYICHLIRNDLIEEFVIYVNKTNISLSKTKIAPSIFETNSFLNKNEPTLIEYAAFFGSIQIFKYLQLNDVELTKSLWLYAIHGNNADIIHILEYNQVTPEDITYMQCYKESIKCHHNDIANYIENIYLNNDLENDYFENLFTYCYHYHNYEYFANDLNEKFIPFYVCKYNYITLIKHFISKNQIDLKREIIHNLLIKSN